MRFCPLAVLVVVFLAGCSTQPPPDAKTEAERIAFCRSVIDVVKPGDKICGPYIKKIRQEDELTLFNRLVGNSVSISSRPEIWTDEYIIATVPNGTKAKRLEEKRYPIPGDQDTVRFLIRTAGPNPVTGWVHSFDVRR